MSSAESRFVSLLDALRQYQDFPDVIAEVIMDDGIWSIAPGQTMLTQNPGDSEAALNALMIVCWLSEIYENDPWDYAEAEEELEREQPVGTFGWPRDNLPDFEGIKIWRYPPLITIDNILHLYRDKYQLSHEDLALKIERDGIYGYKKYPDFVRYSANSAQAQEALSAVSAYLVDSNSDNPQHELYSPEDDPTCCYGWPRENFPEFRKIGDNEPTDWVEPYIQIEFKTRKSFFKEDLYTIGRILATYKATPAHIQTAIEQVGVHGYDAAGRSMHYEWPEDDLFKPTALDKLETDLARFAEPIIQHGVIDYARFDRSSFSVFGWPHGQLPDFAAIAAGKTLVKPNPEVEPDTEVQAQPTTKQTAKPDRQSAQSATTPSASQTGHYEMVPDGAKEGYDLLILALLAFINGEYLPAANSDPYTKQKDLISTILKHFGGSYGLRRTSIATKFADANALRARVGLPPLIKVKHTDHLHREHQVLSNNPRELFAVDDQEDQASPTPRAIGGGTF